MGKKNFVLHILYVKPLYFTVFSQLNGSLKKAQRAHNYNTALPGREGLIPGGIQQITFIFFFTV
jgi:hypothetical protein